MIRGTINKMRFNIDTDDGSLVALMKKDNTRALTIVYNKYYSDVRFHLINKSGGNRFLQNMIDDIVQETFIDLDYNIKTGKYEHRGFLKAYLQKMAWFKFLKLTEVQEEANINSVFTDDDNIKELYNLIDDSNDYLFIANEALKQLSSICKEIILLKYYNKMSDAEIFENYPNLKNIANVRRRRNRCMDNLRKKSKKILEKKGTKL